MPSCFADEFTGTAISLSTFLGGAGKDQAFALALDSSGRDLRHRRNLLQRLPHPERLPANLRRLL